MVPSLDAVIAGGVAEPVSILVCLSLDDFLLVMVNWKSSQFISTSRWVFDLNLFQISEFRSPQVFSD
jgi:hypothetical protein